MSGTIEQKYLRVRDAFIWKDSEEVAMILVRHLYVLRSTYAQNIPWPKTTDIYLHFQRLYISCNPTNTCISG